MAATIAAQALLHSADARLYKCKAAPGPDDVNWSALWCSSEQRFVRRIIGGFMYFAVMCIPLGAFAGVLTEVRPPPRTSACSTCFSSGLARAFTGTSNALPYMVRVTLESALIHQRCK